MAGQLAGYGGISVNLETALLTADAYCSIFRMYDKSFTFVISNLETFEYVVDNLGFGLQEGGKVQRKTAANRILRTKEPLKITIRKEQSEFGKEYVATGIPLFKEGLLCGSLLWVTPGDKFRLAEMANELMSLTGELMATSDVFSTNASEFVQTTGIAVKHANELYEQVRGVDDVNQMVTKISEESHILSINASIEAAYALSEGTGFSAIAEEMHRLASESKRSAQEIELKIKTIEKKVKNIKEKISYISGISENQAESANELSEAIYIIKQLAANLNDLANNH